jgi:glutamine cyclotransferase
MTQGAYRTTLLAAAIGLSLIACQGDAVGRPAAETAEGQTTSAWEVVRSYPHDSRAFTQGLVYHDGYLWEGTGRRGESSVRQVRPETGEIVRRVDLPGSFFGEGIAVFDDRVFQLTWVSGLGFVYDLESLQVVRQFRQFTEGWGLTHDGTHLIMSDGSATLYFLDPETMQPVREIHVLDDGRTIDQINELEFIDGEIFANVWHSDTILRISPETGEVVGRLDLTGILSSGDRPVDPEGVLNGIAYDPETGRIFVTGKLWPRLFEIRLVEQ